MLLSVVKVINAYLSDYILVILLVAVGIWFTIKTGFVQVRFFREGLRHTFGNLTITAYNSSLSNKSFAEKRDRKNSEGNYIGYRNGLNLNDDVADKEKWTVEIIRNRTDVMVEKILAMFRL